MSEWQPIETAPRDRTILVCAPGNDPRFWSHLPNLICTCRWHEDAGFCVDEVREPTHWMPLPADPIVEDKE